MSDVKLAHDCFGALMHRFRLARVAASGSIGVGDRAVGIEVHSDRLARLASTLDTASD